MDESRKRDSSSLDLAADDGERKLARTPPPYDEDDDDVASLLSADVEAFAVLRELLQGPPSPEKPLSAAFSQSPPMFQIPASYVTSSGGNEESCGSCFSDCDSSVMASFDYAGAAAFGGGAWSTEVEEARVHDVDVVRSDGCDYSDEFDWLLARFLGEDVCEN